MNLSLFIHKILHSQRIESKVRQKNSNLKKSVKNLTFEKDKNAPSFNASAWMFNIVECCDHRNFILRKYCRMLCSIYRGLSVG